MSVTRSDDNRRDVPIISSQRANNDDLDGSGPTTSGDQVFRPVSRTRRSPLLSPMAVSMSVPGHTRVTYGSDAMVGRATPSPYNREPVVTRNNQMPLVSDNHSRGDERDHYSTHEVPVHHGASSYRDQMFPLHGHDVKTMRPNTSGIQTNDGTGGYPVRHTDVPSYASEGPQWPTNSRYNASRDAVPAMRTDVNNSAIDDVYAQDALVWDASTRCSATTAYGNTVSSPLMGSNNLRMNQPSHSGYQPSMTAGHARPSVSIGPRNDDGPNTMAGGVHTVQSNVPGGRAGSMPALTRDQTYRPSGYNDGHDVKTMRPNTSGIQTNDGTRGYPAHHTDVPSYASGGPQWPTHSRYSASRDAVPAMRTDVNNSAIDEVYAQDALVWDANTRCSATTAYGNTVSSPLMGSNNLRMNQPSHSGYQPSMTAGHARPSVSICPRNDDDPNTMAGGVHTVHYNVPGGRAGSMPVLTRDQTYRPSGYSDGRNVQTMRTDQSDRLINDDVRDSQGYEFCIQIYARETQWAPISGSVMTRHLISKPIPDLRGPMNYPANSQGTPFRSTNMEAKQPVSSTQMGSNALRSDQHYGVGFQPDVPSYGYRPLHSTGPWRQADDHISTCAPTFPASRLGVDERGSPQPVADHIRKSDTNCRYQSLPPPPPLRFMGTDTNSRANHTVQRFSDTAGGNDEPALMYRASEGSRQVPTTLPGGTVHSSDFRAPVPRPSDQVAVAPRPVESIDVEAELHDLRRKLASFEMLAVEMSGSGVPPPAPGTTLKYSPEGAKLAKKSKSTDKHSDHTTCKSRLKSHK